MTMKANELLKKLGNTLLGKKVNTPAAGGVATVIQLAPEEKARIKRLLAGEAPQ